MKKRTEYRSETGRLEHVHRNVFRYGQTVVTKYLGGYCEAKLGNAMTWTADSEAELVERVSSAGYGPDDSAYSKPG